MIDSAVAVFPEKESLGPRDWGEETLVAVIPNTLTLKILKIDKGNKGGLQFHRLKQEAGLLLSGKLLIRYENASGELKERTISEGQAFVFPKGAIHQEQAIEDCVIIEASSPHLNDRVRVEKSFGGIDEEGLPTTEESEIVHL